MLFMKSHITKHVFFILHLIYTDICPALIKRRKKTKKMKKALAILCILPAFLLSGKNFPWIVYFTFYPLDITFSKIYGYSHVRRQKPISDSTDSVTFFISFAIQLKEAKIVIVEKVR